MRNLFLILFFLLFSWDSVFAQSFFKNSKPLIIWNSGESKPKDAKLKNGGTVRVKFDGTQVNVMAIFGSSGYGIIYLAETEDWKKLQITEYDFDKDNKNELIIAYGDPDQAILKVLVYRLTKSAATELGSFDGQFDCYFEKNKIILPYGYQGLFEEYTLTNGKFINTSD